MSSTALPDSNSAATLTASHAPPAPLKAAGLVVGSFALVGIYIALCLALGITEFFAGFIFLLCWTGVERGGIDRLPHSALGAAFGLAMAYSLKELLASPLGTSGGYVFAAFTMLVVYLLIRGRFTMLINITAMTFLTVATIPYVLGQGDFGNMALSLAVGIIYFGLIFSIPVWLASRRASSIARHHI